MAQDTAQARNGTLLRVNNIEVIYDHVILVLKGVSLEVAEGGVVALLGANGAGKSTTLKSISNLLGAERGVVTKGSITYQNENVHSLSPNELVNRGVVQVMEGRHCFEHLTVEENLLTGAYTRSDGRAAIQQDLELVYKILSQVERAAQSPSRLHVRRRATNACSRSGIDGTSLFNTVRRTVNGSSAAAG